MLQILRTFIFRRSLSALKKAAREFILWRVTTLSLRPIFISLYLSPDSLLMAVHPSFRVLQQQPTPILSFWLDFMTRDAEMERYHTMSCEPFPYIIVRLKKVPSIRMTPSPSDSRARAHTTLGEKPSAADDHMSPSFVRPSLS